MKVNFIQKNISLNDDQKDYIEKKINNLTKLAKRIDDESSQTTIEVEKLSSSPHRISLIVNVKVPAHLFRAEIEAKKIEEAIDICEEKLRSQIEKYKAKFGKNDMHTRKSIKEEDTEDQGNNEFEDLIE